MGKNAELFVKEEKHHRSQDAQIEKLEKEKTEQLETIKKRHMAELIGFFIIFMAIVFTVYRFQSGQVELYPAITQGLILSIFGGIFIMIGKHYSN